MRLLALFSCPDFCSVPQYWAHCRWANPSDPMDCNVVAEKLARMQQMHVQLRQCSLDRVLSVISLLRIPRPPSKDSESESDSDSPESSSRPIDEKQLPSLAGLGWMHSSPSAAPGQSVHLPPLSMGNIMIDAVRSPRLHAALPIFVFAVVSLSS